MPTSVALGTRFEAFVREQVGSGHYNNVSEVVRDGLRLLEQRQQEDAAKLRALQRAVASGVAALDEGSFEVVEANEIDAFVDGLGRGHDHPAKRVSKREPARKPAARRGSAK